ncbi:hypothetical protein V5O48_009006, partial [Marasmius crinis-equi]
LAASFKPKKIGKGNAPLVPVNISLLCGSLTKAGIEIKGKLWARIAFLRFLLRKFNRGHGKAPNGSSLPAEELGTPDASSSSKSSSVIISYQFHQFWDFVDAELVKTRQRALKEGKSLIGQQQKLAQFFQIILAQDLRDFPSTFAQEPDRTPVQLPWQQRFAKAMAW